MTTKNFDQSWLDAARANNAHIASNFEDRRKAVKKTAAGLDEQDQQNRIARAVVAQAIDDARRENEEEAAQLRRIAINAGLDPDAAAGQQQGAPQGTPPAVPQPTQQLPVVQPARTRRGFKDYLWLVWALAAAVVFWLGYRLVADSIAQGNGNFATKWEFITVLAIGVFVGVALWLRKKNDNNGQANT